MPHDGGRLGHGATQFLVQEVGVFRPAPPLQQSVVVPLVPVPRRLEKSGRQFVSGPSAAAVQQVDNPRGHEKAAEDAAQQRVGPQAVGAVVLVVAFADGEQAGDVGLLVCRCARL